MAKRIGLLTGGGDVPVLNPCVRAVVCKANDDGDEVIGIRRGWKGLLHFNPDDDESISKHTVKLTKDLVRTIARTGGTVLHTSRTNPYKVEGGPEKVKENLKKLKCDYLIAIGGEDTLGVANKLAKDGVKVVGVPKTIDNDLSETDYTFGFNTAITRACEAIENLHTTAKSHHRTIVVEVMGRHAGWMTLEAGIGGGASVILLPILQSPSR